MSETPNFANPPIVELVLGVQFSPLTKLTAGHFGLFWNQLGSDWVDPVDQPSLEDQFETFDQPRFSRIGAVELRLEPLRTFGRFTVGHQDKQRLIQVQSSRFHSNWRKRVGFYPSYRQLIAEFESMFARFTGFVHSAELGEVVLNQWELTYIDAFPQGEYWETPRDWSSFLPGLFGTLPSAEGLVLEHRAAEWSYEIAPKRGRLHIATQTGRTAEGSQALLLQMTARGPIGKGGVESFRVGLDLGHDAALDLFLRATSEEAQKRWEKKP